MSNLNKSYKIRIRIHSRYISLFVLFLVSAIWIYILVVSGSAFSGFHFTDDHEIVAINHDLNVLNIDIFTEIKNWVLGDVAARFRPFYVVHRVIQTNYFGINWVFWSFYNAFLAITTTFLLFIFGKSIFLNTIESLILAFITTLGVQSAIWHRLGPNETIGIFLMSLTLNLTVLSVKVNRFKLFIEAILLASIILLSLCKESFIFLIPAILVIKIWLSSKLKNISILEALKNNQLLVTLSLFLLLIELAIIKLFVGTDFGYAGLEINFLKTINAFHGYGQNIYNLLLIILSLICVFYLKDDKNQSGSSLSNSENTRDFVFIFLLFLLVLVPQSLIYTKSGVFERYLIPGILGYSIAITYLLKIIRQRSKLVAILFYIVIFIYLSTQLNYSFLSAQKFAAEGRHTNELLQIVEDNTSRMSKIVIVTHPWAYYEWSGSITKYLKYVSERDNLYLITYGSLSKTSQVDFNTNSGSLKKSEKELDFLNPQKISHYYKRKKPTDFKEKERGEIDCIVVFPKLNKDFIRDSVRWIDLKKFQVYKFTNEFNTSFILYLKS